MQQDSDVVRYQHPDLEDLRLLLAYKAQLAGPEVTELVALVDNPVLARVFDGIVADAPRERALLEATLGEWAAEARRTGAAPPGVDPTYRAIVAEWVRLLDAAAARALAMAARAPTDELRQRLEGLGRADRARADALRSVL